MRMLIAALLLALPLSAQSWDDVRVREGAVFHILHPDLRADIPQVSAPLQVSAAVVQVSFSPQGAKVLETLTGKRIAGVGIHEVLMCSSDGAPIRAGAVYQLAVSHGIEPISPPLARALFRTTVKRNWRNYAIAIPKYGTLGLPVAAQMKLISMTSNWVIGLLGGHLFTEAVQDDLRANLPDPEPLLGSLLDPEGIVQFGGNCRESKIVTRYGKVVVSGTFPLQ